MSELDDRLRRAFLDVRERVEHLPLPDIADREPLASRSRVPRVVTAAVVVVLVAGAAVIAARSQRETVPDRRGPSSPSSSSVPTSAGAFVHTLVFSGERVQQLNIDSDRAPTDLAIMWPASLGGSDAPLAISSPAVDRSHTRIVFVVGSPGNPGVGAIAVANLDGSSARTLADGPDNAAPAWSWDGSRIAFLHRGIVQIVDADGSGERSLGVEASSVSWSPDGRTLAIRNVGEPIRILLFTIATRRAGLITLPDAAVEQFAPAWSPDGRSIVYGQRFAYASRPPGLFVAKADGSDVRRLTSCRAPCEEDDQPTWSSDGAFIAFVRRLTTESAQQIYVVAAGADAAAVRQVTSGPQPHDSPSW